MKFIYFPMKAIFTLNKLFLLLMLFGEPFTYNLVGKCKMQLFPTFILSWPFFLIWSYNNIRRDSNSPIDSSFVAGIILLSLLALPSYIFTAV